MARAHKIQFERQRKPALCRLWYKFDKERMNEDVTPVAVVEPSRDPDRLRAILLRRRAVLLDVFREVWYTDQNMQVVLMSVLASRRTINIAPRPVPSTQLITLHRGCMEFSVNGGSIHTVSVGTSEQDLLQGSVTVVVPANTPYEIINCGMQALKLSIVYAPPLFEAGLVQEQPSVEDLQDLTPDNADLSSWRFQGYNYSHH